MEIDLNQVAHSALGSGWLVPILGGGSWALVKYLSDKFITTQTFDNYIKAQEKKYKELKEEMEEGIERARDNDKDLYEKNRELGLEVAKIEGKLEK